MSIIVNLFIIICMICSSLLHTTLQATTRQGILVFVASIIFVYKANPKRDGIFVRGPDAFFSDALAIISGDSEYFHIFHFFEEESGEPTILLFSLDFEEETKTPEITQTVSFSFYFAWFAGSLFIITGILAYILTRRLGLESGETTIFATLTMGLLLDKAKKEPEKSKEINID